MSMPKCFECRKEVPDGVFRCDNCYKGVVKAQKDRKRRPMSEWEEMKLGFLKDNKKWVENIQNRKIMEKDGRKIEVYRTPRGEIRPMPTSRERHDGKFY